MAKRKRKDEVPSPSDWRDSEETIRTEVIASLHSAFTDLATTHVNTLRGINRTSAELRHSLELIEAYREMMAIHFTQVSSNLSSGYPRRVTPDGRYEFDDEKGWQRRFSD